MSSVVVMGLLVLAALHGPVCAVLMGMTQPAGFATTEYFAGDVPGARSIAISGGAPLAGQGPVVYVASSSEGKVFALLDQDNNGFADKRVTLMTGLNTSNGVAWHDGDLYVAELTKVWRLPDIDAFVAKGCSTYPESAMQLLTNALPETTQHGARYIAVSPAGQLHLSIGSPCNACKQAVYQKNSSTAVYQYGSIVRYNLSNFHTPELVAHGIRNSVGFAWHPDTDALYFTDNGRDNIGGSDASYTDNHPDDELNMLAEQELPAFFGFPYCHTGAAGGGDVTPCQRAAGIGDPIPDPQFNQNEQVYSCDAVHDDYVPAVQALGPHLAALGMTFYKQNTSAQYAFPVQYDSAAFIAQHGSWNRQAPAGYRVVSVSFNSTGAPMGVTPFLSGFLQGDTAQPDCPAASSGGPPAVAGRPVDVKQHPDGSLLLSDDKAGRVYKIMFTGRVGVGGTTTTAMG